MVGLKNVKKAPSPEKKHTKNRMDPFYQKDGGEIRLNVQRLVSSCFHFSQIFHS